MDTATIISIVMFIVGLAVLVFRKKIGIFYDRNPYLSDKEKKYYKNIVLRIVGAIFLFGGAAIFTITVLPDFMKEVIADFFSYNIALIEIICGFIMVCIGILIVIIRIFKKDSWLIKLGPMKSLYGEKKGSIIHIIEYIAVPLILGGFLIFLGIFSS